MSLTDKQRRIIGELERWLARPNQSGLDGLTARLESYLSNTQAAKRTNWLTEIVRRLA